MVNPKLNEKARKSLSFARLQAKGIDFQTSFLTEHIKQIGSSRLWEAHKTAEK